MKMTNEIWDHWDRIAGLGCCICERPAEVAHCHGGSISEILGPDFRPGWGQRQNHWLVIPLCPEHHRGNKGLDTGQRGVSGWEEEYGTQVEWLEEVSNSLGYCLFKRAGAAGYTYQFMDPPVGAAEPEPPATDALEGADAL